MDNKELVKRILFEMQYKRKCECDYYYPKEEREKMINELIEKLGVEVDSDITLYSNYVLEYEEDGEEEE